MDRVAGFSVGGWHQKNPFRALFDYNESLLDRVCPDIETRLQIQGSLSEYFILSENTAAQVEKDLPGNRFGNRLHIESITLPEEAEKLGLFQGLTQS